MDKQRLINGIVLSIIIIFLFPLKSLGQIINDGIKFEVGLNWQQIKAKAQKENKYIFMDCFATWCGPCKEMDKEVYTQKVVGDYFNSRFVSVKVQMDQTPHDVKVIKDWYLDASAIKRQYLIDAYPTFLIFSPDGQAVHKIVGAKNETDFIAKAEEAFDPGKQYYTMIGQWKDHTSDSAFLYHALTMALNLYDYSNVKVIGDAFIDNLKDPFTKENLGLISRITFSSKDKGFIFFINYEPRIDEVIGKPGAVKSIVIPIIYSEEIKPQLKSGTKTNWVKMRAEIKMKYPQLELWNEPSVDSAFLTNILMAAMDEGDKEIINNIGKVYLASLKDPFEKNNIQLVYDFTKSINDVGFHFLLNNQQKIDRKMGNDFAEKKLSDVISIEEIQPLFSQSITPINYKKNIAELHRRYPTLNLILTTSYKNRFQSYVSNEIISMINKSLSPINWGNIKIELATRFIGYDYNKPLLQNEAKYYADKQLWEECENITFALFRQYGSSLSDSELNDYSWYNIFLHGTKKEALLEACKWMKISIDRSPHIETLDTYANLLYKYGKTTEAILLENKALALAQQFKSKDNERVYIAILDKMQKGEKTW